MAERVQIYCVNKGNHSSAYERIEFVSGIHGGTSWTLSVSEAIKAIENGTYSFYTAVGGHIRNVKVGSRYRVKYLKIDANSDAPDHLLSLPDCI